MTWCAVIEFRDEKAFNKTEFSNSWGGAARIWDALYKKYLKNPNVEYDNWLSDSMKAGGTRLWDLVKDDRVAEFEKAIHCATFDNMIVRRENFQIFARHLLQFSKAYPWPLDHLPAWSKLISESTAVAIGFHHTSVTENPWFSYHEETGEVIPYDLRTGDKHSEVYEALKAEFV